MATPESVPVDWDRLENEARGRFDVRDFRPGQRDVIEAVLAGRDVHGVLPTGGGKSLCYQLPARFLPQSPVVVSPLIALTHDQQEKLASSGHDRDCERLDAMMRWAQSTACRSRLLREYFGAPPGDPCGSCDDCRTDAPHALAAAAARG
jgi:ATP-dependent DNA helicase RecQ